MATINQDSSCTPSREENCQIPYPRTSIRRKQQQPHKKPIHSEDCILKKIPYRFMPVQNKACNPVTVTLGDALEIIGMIGPGKDAMSIPNVALLFNQKLRTIELLRTQEREIEAQVAIIGNNCCDHIETNSYSPPQRRPLGVVEIRHNSARPNSKKRRRESPEPTSTSKSVVVPRYNGCRGRGWPGKDLSSLFDSQSGRSKLNAPTTSVSSDSEKSTILRSPEMDDKEFFQESTGFNESASSSRVANNIINSEDRTGLPCFSDEEIDKLVKITEEFLPLAKLLRFI